jgi:Asp-tRNA(Asn)/Glu-tRNA(Gln) amidotransferase A subunit family amidase
MTRILSLLFTIGALVAFVHFVPAHLAHPSGEDRLGAIRKLSLKVLQPLESDTSLSTVDARKALSDLTAKVTTEQSNPESNRAMQALQLIEKALAERNAYLARAQSGSARSGLDRVPGKWHVVGHPEQAVDRQAISHQQKSAFWTEATLKEWRLRCDAYQASIDALLTPTTPRP